MSCKTLIFNFNFNLSISEEVNDGKYDYIAQGSGTGGSGKWYLIPGGNGPSGTISDPSSVWPGLTYDARDNTYELYGNRGNGSTLNTSNTNNVLLIENPNRFMILELAC